MKTDGWFMTAAGLKRKAGTARVCAPSCKNNRETGGDSCRAQSDWLPVRPSYNDFSAFVRRPMSALIIAGLLSCRPMVISQSTAGGSCSTAAPASAEPVVGEAPGATSTVAVQQARVHAHGLRDEAAMMLFPSAVVTGNWLSGGTASRYPPGNRFETPFDTRMTAGLNDRSGCAGSEHLEAPADARPRGEWRDDRPPTGAEEPAHHPAVRERGASS
jgi:hypothetical protein